MEIVCTKFILFYSKTFFEISFIRSRIAVLLAINIVKKSTFLFFKDLTQNMRVAVIVDSFCSSYLLITGWEIFCAGDNG